MKMEINRVADVLLACCLLELSCLHIFYSSSNTNNNSTSSNSNSPFRMAYNYSQQHLIRCNFESRVATSKVPALISIIWDKHPISSTGFRQTQGEGLTLHSENVQQVQDEGPTLSPINVSYHQQWHYKRLHTYYRMCRKRVENGVCSIFESKV